MSQTKKTSGFNVDLCPFSTDKMSSQTKKQVWSRQCVKLTLHEKLYLILSVITNVPKVIAPICCKVHAYDMADYFHQLGGLGIFDPNFQKKLQFPPLTWCAKNCNLPTCLEVLGSVSPHGDPPFQLSLEYPPPPPKKKITTPCFSGKNTISPPPYRNSRTPPPPSLPVITTTPLSAMPSKSLKAGSGRARRSKSSPLFWTRRVKS